MVQNASAYMTVWFMKFVIFLSRGWFDPNWALRRTAVYSMREKIKQRRHHNSTIIVFTNLFKSQPQHQLIGPLPFTWSPCPAGLSPGFHFLVNFFSWKIQHHGLLSGKCRCWQSQKMPNHPCHKAILIGTVLPRPKIRILEQMVSGSCPLCSSLCYFTFFFFSNWGIRKFWVFLVWNNEETTWYILGKLEIMTKKRLLSTACGTYVVKWESSFFDLWIWD